MLKLPVETAQVPTVSPLALWETLQESGNPVLSVSELKHCISISGSSLIKEA